LEEERGNKMTGSRKSKTHFEQVPLEIVKSIAREESLDDEANGKDETAEAPKKPLSRIPRGRARK
jgi:hypothetical protein